MTDQTQETRGRIDRRRRLLAALLALAMLIPLGTLCFGHYRYVSQHRSVAAQERHGIEYLLALGNVTIALTDAQSAAVRGEPVAQDVLAEAVADVTEVDDRFGAELRVRDRWSQLRDAIELAASADHADGNAAYAAYGEAADQLLGLHVRLRDTAGLVRDPDPDTHHLQDAAAGQLPATIVAAVQLADLLTLALDAPAGAQAAQPFEVSAAVAAVAGPADEFVVGVQAALDSTASRSLSSAVLSKYDRFLRAKDGMLAAVPPDGDIEAVDFELLEVFRGEMRAAGADLSATLLTELDTLVESRASQLARSQWTAVLAGSIGVLLAFGAAAVSLVRSVRQPTDGPRPGQLGTGGAGIELDGGRGAGSGRELPTSQISISDTAAGAGSRPSAPPGGDRLASLLPGSERIDVR